MTARLEGRNAVGTAAGRGLGRGATRRPPPPCAAPPPPAPPPLAKGGASVVVNDPGVNVDGSGHDAGPADQVAGEIRAAGGTAGARDQRRGRLVGGGAAAPPPPLKAHDNPSKPASVLMRQQRYGRIVNFSSISGLRGISGQS